MRNESLQLGSVVVHYCLKALTFGSQHNRLGGTRSENNEYFSLIDHVTRLFEWPEILEYDDVYTDLCISFTALLCCVLAHWPPSAVMPFIMRFIRAHHSNIHLIPEFGLVLGVFAFSRCNYPIAGYQRLSLLHQSPDRRAARMERALGVLWYYLSQEELYPPSLAVLGLNHLRSQGASYRLGLEDRQKISDVLRLYPSLTGQMTSIHTLPADFDIYSVSE
jgi:hypothetical protein